MKMHLDSSANNLVTDYGTGYICINGQRYEQSVVVNSTTLSEAWSAASVNELTLEDFEPILATSPEIIILGSGQSHIFPDMQMMADISARGSSLEVMNTSAACRTYNVLVSEFRQVTAVLMQIR